MRASCAAELGLLAMVVAGCVQSVPGAAVGPEEIKRELVGRVWQVKLPDGTPATEHFNADGSVWIVGGLDDQGHWRLSDDGYCTAWRRIRHGAERCFKVEKTPDGQYRIYKPNGEISMTIVGFK